MVTIARETLKNEVQRSSSDRKPTLTTFVVPTILTSNVNINIFLSFTINKWNAYFYAFAYLLWLIVRYAKSEYEICFVAR